MNLTKMDGRRETRLLNSFEQCKGTRQTKDTKEELEELYRAYLLLPSGSKETVKDILSNGKVFGNETKFRYNGVAYIPGSRKGDPNWKLKNKRIQMMPVNTLKASCLEKSWQEEEKIGTC